MKILGIDPGKNNFACSLVDHRGRVLKVGYIETMTHLTADSVIAEAKKFRVSIKTFIDQCQLDPAEDYIVAERMGQRRGQGGGGVVECINIMLGQMIEIAQPIETYLVMPATWKNHYLRKYETNDSSVLLEHLGLSVHETDSVMIACYSFEHDYGKVDLHKQTKLMKGAA